MSLSRDIVYGAAALLSSPVWAWRMTRTGKWRTDWAQRFGRSEPGPADGRKTLLIHAVSVGENDAIRLLVKRLHAMSGGQFRIVISATTDTGIARARDLYQPAHAVVRYPFDFTAAVDRFLDAVRPDVVALVELEVWPNFVDACTARGAAVCIVNGRLTQRSFKRYCLIRPFVQPTFATLERVLVQNRPIADRFIAMGARADRVEVADTMKWDTAEILDHVDGADPLAVEMGIDRSRPLIVAGSTGPGEDKLLIDTCPPDAQLLLAPRKPEWFDDVAALAPGMVRRSAHGPGAARAIDGTRLFLLDTIGELRTAYALADVAIVGRSFLGLYGSNMMEPIGLGKPTITGPHHSNFADVVAALQHAGGIIVTDRPGEAAADLLADPPRARKLAEAGRRVIQSRQGSTQRHAQMLVNLLNQHPTPASL